MPRGRRSAIETFKTLKGFNNVQKEKWFQLEEEHRRPTRQNAEATDEEVRKKENVLQTEAARLEIRRNFYNVRATKTWNAIPEIVKNQTSVSAFKNAYYRWKSNADQ